MVRLSSHFRFLRPSAVAIISASVDEGEPTLCLYYFCIRGKKCSFSISIQYGYCRHDEMPMRHHNEDEILILDNKL